jgi:hypothetical protein
MITTTTPSDYEKIEAIVNHHDNVESNAMLLGQRLMKAGEVDLGRNLIANGLIHDYSKFHGIEFDHMWRNNPDTDSMALAVKQHNRTNLHHPEYWGGIKNMPRLYIAEMVCDWKARSNEFGTSLLEWINGAAAKRYGFCQQDKVYEDIMYFFSLLCDQPFTAIRPEGG